MYDRVRYVFIVLVNNLLPHMFIIIIIFIYFILFIYLFFHYVILYGLVVMMVMS